MKSCRDIVNPFDDMHGFIFYGKHGTNVLSYHKFKSKFSWKPLKMYYHNVGFNFIRAIMVNESRKTCSN